MFKIICDGMKAEFLPTLRATTIHNIACKTQLKQIHSAVAGEKCSMVLHRTQQGVHISNQCGG